MSQNDFPQREALTICFAHVAYQMEAKFVERQTNLNHFQVRTPDDLRARLSEADVLVISGLWRNDLLDLTPRLRYIQSIGAGYDQFPLTTLAERGIRLASAKGVNRNAVSEHAMALILAFTRHLHTGRDYQRQRHWRGMITDLSLREEELGGKTLLIIGLGSIGARLARLARAFDMRVIATKRDPTTAAGQADEIYPPERLPDLLPQADFVVLTCPLTPQTERLINKEALDLMKGSAYLINVARGGCVNEPDLIEALQNGQIAGAGLDHLWDEPLPDNSPFWTMPHVLITPHTAGETRLYEDNVIDILLENLDRLWRGEVELHNQIV